MIRRALLSLIVVLIAVQTAAAQGADRVSLRLVAGSDAAVPGRTLHLAVEQTIAQGWHTYWVNPGDSGEPMKIDWTLPAGVKVGDLLWPAPERIPYGPLMNFGYHEQAVVLTDVSVPQNAAGSFTIKGRAKVLVCDEICVPETHDVALTLPVAPASRPDNEALFAQAAARMPQPVDWTARTEIDADEVRVVVALPADAADFAQGADDIVWFPLTWGYIENASDQFATFDPATRTLTLRQRRDDARDMAGVTQAQYLLETQGRSVIVGGPAVVVAQNAPVRAAARAGEPVSLPGVVLLALLGGLVLNLMPCVFPVLSMKALHLVALPVAERGQAQKAGLLYAAGVVATFLALGGALMAIRAAGQQLGWGFQLQNPAVVTGIAWLLFVTGLNLVGVFNLRVAFGGEVILAEKQHPHLAAFLSGVLATMVATPCSGPFMATALGVALIEPVPVALGIFAAVGVGLAAPFTLLCLVPPLQRILPRPGAWMETFRQVLAFPMFASSVWLVWVVAQQGGEQAVGWTLGGMVSLAFAIWLLGRHPVRRMARRAVMLAGGAVLALTVLSLGLIMPRSDASARAQDEFARPFSAESFDHAINDSDAPVFVNMTASWCITCLVNEKVTLDTTETHDLFTNKRVVYLKGDWTNQDAGITAFLQRYGRSGVPLYVYFGAPDAATGVRPQGVLLPQILSLQVMYDTVK